MGIQDSLQGIKGLGTGIGMGIWDGMGSMGWDFWMDFGTGFTRGTKGWGTGIEAAAMERELLEDYRFGRQQLIEIWGHACAVAVTKAFPLVSLPRRQPTVLVLCGPEQIGAVGLVCARHLRCFDYEPTIFYPRRSPDSLHRDFTTQCEKMDIPFLSYLPAEVTPNPKSPGFPLFYLSLVSLSRVPLVPFSCPHRWRSGPGDTGDIRPAVLVSLAAPKEVSRRFQGRWHFLAGRFLPEELRRKFGICGPPYAGSDCLVAL
uniref:YjeF N-terminal domain-containing protein n=1 Tax=Zosterops lateralis melanops TaxID=1220523 RepID=A0A8D2QV63_ZOSLA